MAKRSRRPVTPRPAPTPASSTTPPDAGEAPISGTPSIPSGSSGSTGTGSEGSAPRPTRPNRSTTRPRRTVAQQPSFFERYRAPIIGVVALVGIAIVGYFFLTQNGQPQGTFVASGPKYVCDSLLTPGPSDTLPPPPPSFPATPTPLPTPSPSPTAAPSVAPTGSGIVTGSPSASAEASPSAAPSAVPSASPAESGSPAASAGPTPAPTIRLGFGTSILGRDHILNAGQTIEYGFCPPTSGNHYNIPGVGPIRAAVYPATAEQPPGGWVHNLEHGWVVQLYSCKNGCPSDAEMAQMQALFDQAPTPDPAQACPAPNKELIVARFDSMTTRFAELAWGRALMTNDFNLDTALTFAQQWTDPGTEPEKTTC